MEDFDAALANLLQDLVGNDLRLQDGRSAPAPRRSSRTLLASGSRAMCPSRVQHLPATEALLHEYGATSTSFVPAIVAESNRPVASNPFLPSILCRHPVHPKRAIHLIHSATPCLGTRVA